MGLGDWIAVVAGALLMVLALVDLFLTVLHPDIDGPVAGAVQGGLWRLLVAGNRRRKQRRRLMALAGPLMMVVTFAVWVLTFTVGFALVIWPFLGDAYDNQQAIPPPGFLDALYYSGTTVSTLGYGDITPSTRPLRLLAVVASLSGFSMLTGIVAYLLEVLGSLHSRVRLALRVGEDTDGRHDGAEVLADWLADEELGDVRQRLEKWGDLLRDAQDEMHRFPLVSVCYRSRDPHQDPEPAVRSVAQIVIAGLLLADDDRYRRLRTSVRGLDRAVTRFMVVVARQYLSKDLTAALAEPQPTDADRDHVDDVGRRLHETLGAGHDSGPEVRASAMELACRTRTFLDGFHRLTGWQAADPSSAEQPVKVPTLP